MLTGDRSKNETLDQAFPLFLAGEYDFCFTRSPWDIGLHSTCPNSLKKKIAAAVISESLALKSVDNVARNHLKDLVYPDPDKNRLDIRIRGFITEKMNIFGSQIDLLKERRDRKSNQTIAEWTLSRSPFSMELLAHCGQRGALFEGLAIARMMLEQIAWAYVVSLSDDENAVHKISATASISKFKGISGFSGNLYGWLSEHAHWTYDGHKKSFISKGDEGEFGHLLASPYFKVIVFCVMLLLIQSLFDCLWTILPTDMRADPSDNVSPDIIKTEVEFRLQEVLGCDPEDEDLNHLVLMLAKGKA